MNKVEKSSIHFYGVYMLCSQSVEKRYNGKCYIGYTVNPNRRINQHNRGIDHGGAKKTSNKGPWKMVLIVHNFPNNIAALQFEWAWQQPTLSSRLKVFNELRRKQPKENHVQYNIRILCQMLQVGPWNRLPLIIQWLETDYECNLPSTDLPTHIQIARGTIDNLKGPKRRETQIARDCALECHLCMQLIPIRSRIGCLNDLCKLTCHLICLANYLLTADVRNSGHYIPISGACPLCEMPLQWAALLKHKNKINDKAENQINFDEDEDVSDMSKTSNDEELTDDFLPKLSNDVEIFELSE